MSNNFRSEKVNYVYCDEIDIYQPTEEELKELDNNIETIRIMENENIKVETFRDKRRPNLFMATITHKDGKDLVSQILKQQSENFAKKLFNTIKD